MGTWQELCNGCMSVLGLRIEANHTAMQWPERCGQAHQTKYCCHSHSRPSATSAGDVGQQGSCAWNSLANHQRPNLAAGRLSCSVCVWWCDCHDITAMSHQVPLSHARVEFKFSSTAASSWQCKL